MFNICIPLTLLNWFRVASCQCKCLILLPESTDSNLVSGNNMFRARITRIMIQQIICMHNVVAPKCCNGANVKCPSWLGTTS